MAAGGPEAGISGPYVYWRVAPALAGATFDLERSERGWLGWGSFSSLMTVSDCVSTGCSTSGDRDPDPGEFQVTLPTDSGGWFATDYRYRVIPVTAPQGYNFDSVAGASMPASIWNGGPYDFGPFSAARNAAIACVADQLYGVSATGAVSSIAVSGSTATVTALGGWSGVSGVNALAAAADGTLYALNRSESNSTVTNVLRYQRDLGWQSLPSSAYSTAQNLIAGAVNPTNGNYYFGGSFQEGGSWKFRVHRYSPTTGQFSPVAILETGTSSEQNADIAFDAAGDLVLLHSPLSGGTSATRYEVPAATINAASGATRIAVAGVAVAIGVNNVNGIAFDADDSLYVGTTSDLRRVARGASSASSVAVTGLSGSQDLASCAPPVTVTVQKSVPARVGADDQFTLRMREGTNGTVLGSVTTLGGEPGLQQQRLSRLKVPTAASFTITETMASGNAADYSASWSCTSNGAPHAAGTGTSITLTTPSVAGAEVVCTFTNTPVVTQVTVRKIVQDVDGANPVARERWTVGATVAGAAAVTPASTPTQQTGADGAARWSVRHSGTTANASVTVSETQQSGFRFVSAECIITPLTGSARTVTIASEAGTTLTGVTPGSAVQCTFVNRMLPTTLTLVKSVPFGTEAATTWQLRATGPQSALPGPAGVTGSAQATGRITPGEAYRLSESGGPATYVQTGAWQCTDERGASVAVTTAGDVTVARAGAQVRCTVTNQTARLTLLKTVVNDSGGTIGPEQFSLTATPASSPVVTGLGGFTVTGASAVASGNTREVRPGHAYSLAEDMGEFAYLGQSVQRYTGPANPTTAQLTDDGNWQTLTAAQAAAFTVAAGQHAIVRFVNDDAPALTLPLTGGMGADTYLLGGAGVLVLGLLAAAFLLVRTRLRSGREARLT